MLRPFLLKGGWIKMKFAYFGYRAWAYNLFNKLDEEFEIDSFTIPKTEYPKDKKISVIDKSKIPELEFEKYNALLFYGWSWILPQKIVDNNQCVCLHPSPLPLYRGGSPTQNQIIEGEDESAVTLFKMGRGLDNGPIYYQKRFSLRGNLSEIFERISDIGSELTNKLLKDFENQQIKTYTQDESKATTYKRRKPEQSELKLTDLEHMSARQLHDFIRALQDPYPNAYIIGKDGEKVFLTKSKLETTL